MRLKGDSPKAWGKPGHNVQIGKENQFVVGFSVPQRPGDTGCLVPHLEQVKERLGRLPKNVIADGGNGSEVNYEYQEAKKMGSYVKYNTFHQNRRRKARRVVSVATNFLTMKNKMC